MTVPAHPAYRPDIDGLRAVAVLSVVGFHTFPSWFPGGFVGVDIFFVISGYLITTIILGDLAGEAFSFRVFYARRIKRIFPALILVLASVWIGGWLRLWPDEYRQLGKHIAGGSAFVSNFVLREESGYFDNVAQSKPLLHLWSLAIEEQFYIFWPLILAVATRGRSRSIALWIIVAIAVLSFAFDLSILDTEPERAFFSPFSRFWELMVGGLLAYGLRGRPSHFEHFREARSICGVALVLAGIFGLTRTMPFPGWRALLPTVGTFLVISAGPAARLNRLFLSTRPAVWVGKISYPLYLWHWPPLAFLFVAETDEASRTVRVAIVVASVFLAWATYHFVETPLRRSASLRTPVALCVGLAALGIVGLATLQADGFVNRFDERGAWVASFDNATPERRYSERNGTDAKYREECNFYDMARWRGGHSTLAPRDAIDPTCYTRPTGTSRAVLLWGDSHAEHLNWGLREVLPRDVALLQVASSGCLPALVDDDTPVTSHCAKSNQFALSVVRRERPDVVVIAQRDGHRLPVLRALARALKSAGAGAVVVLGPVPQWKPELPKTIASHYWPTPPDRLATHLDPAIVATERIVKTWRKPDEPFVYVDLFDALCDPRGCRTYVDEDWHDALMTFDYGHFTPRASVFVARTVLGPTIAELLGARAMAAAASR